jgi:hypothetical protein
MFRALAALEETITALVEVELQLRQLAYTTDLSQWS